MTKYRVMYWLASSLKVATVEANDIKEALVIFYLHHTCDDVISITLWSDRNV